MRSRVTFESQGLELSGLLETPDQAPLCYALFAHCFTCGKDVAAASRISRSLVARDIAVLRFDFTGLGNSDGDFANTNFSSNTADLLAAADFLKREYGAPSILIGHSLGGAAVLAVAGQIDSVKAVVSIAAPFEAEHVIHNFSANIEHIEQSGAAEVTLGARTFTIKKQFLDDLRAQNTDHIGNLGKALLVMHSPLDTTVDITDAERIYKAAKHPKSFVSLDKADHLLSKKHDSEYAAAVIAGWASAYIDDAAVQSRASVEKGHVLVEEKNQSFTQHVSSDSHYWLADEPKALGGNNTGPDPYEHLLAALGACTSITLRFYAKRESIPLDHVKVEVSHARNHMQDCEDCEKPAGPVEVLTRTLTLEGDLSEAQRTKLVEIANKCPVHKTLHGDLQIETQLLD